MQAFLILALLAADPEPASAPTGPPPQLVFLESKGGMVIQSITVAVPVSVTEKYTVIVGGKTEERTRTVTKYQFVMKKVEIALEKAMFFTAGGKKLKPEDARKHLAKGAVVLLARGAVPEAAYLNAFKADTLVIVMPIQPNPER